LLATTAITTRSRSLNQAYPLSLCHHLGEAVSLKDAAIPHKGRFHILGRRAAAGKTCGKLRVLGTPDNVNTHKSLTKLVTSS